MGNIPIITAGREATSPIPETRASPNAFGAQIGSAIASLGGNVTELAAVVAARDDQARGLDADLALSTARFDMTQALIEAEQGAGPGGTGFVEGFTKSFDEYQTKVLAGFPDAGKVRDHLVVGLANLRTDLGNKAQVSAASMFGKQQAENARSALDTGINTVAVDPTQYDAVVAAGLSTIDALKMPDFEKQALKSDYVTAAVAARFQALFNAAKTPDDVAAIRKDLETGPWKGLMSANQGANGAKAFDDMLAIAYSTERSMRAAIKTAATSAIDSVETRMTDGANVDREEINAVTTQVRQAADEALTRRWAKIATQYSTTQFAKPLSTPELRLYEEGLRGRATPEQSSMLDYRGAIASIETTRGTGGYTAVGPKTKKGDHAYGRYQVMGENIPAWTREALGRSMTIQEFVSNSAAQDAVFDFKFGQYLKKTGNAADAAAMWFSGRPLAESAGDDDGYITVAQYVKRFENALGNPDRLPSPSEVAWTKADAAKKVLDAREARIAQGDIMGVASDSGLVKLGQLTDADAYRVRSIQAQIAAEQYDDDVKPFTPVEVEHFKRVMDEGTIDDKLGVIQNVAAMGDVAKSAWKQVGEKSPMFGYVGGLSMERPAVAREVLRGAQKIQDDPDLKDLLITGAAGGTTAKFFGVVGGGFDMIPDAASAVRQAADALYIERVGGAGAGAFNPNEYSKAVKDALGASSSDGGTVRVNGEVTILPPNVSGSDFKTMLAKAEYEDYLRFSVGGGPPTYAGSAPRRGATPLAERFSTAFGTTAAADEIEREGKFKAIGAGAYIIIMADGRPLAGTGPNGFYVFQIDARGVADVLKKPRRELSPFGTEIK